MTETLAPTSTVEIRDHSAPHARLAAELLGLGRVPPLTPDEMATSLEVAFLRPHQHTARLTRFAEALREALAARGVRVAPIEEAFVGQGGQGRRKFRPGLTVVETGEGADDALAANFIPGLHQTAIVTLIDGPPPVHAGAGLQQTLDAIVGVLAWNMTHVPIFVEDGQWTICTMNGAVIPCGDWRRMDDGLMGALVPKLTAQVVPPQRDSMVWREGAFDPVGPDWREVVADFLEAAPVWRDSGLMLAHTSLDTLQYRNRYFRRLVAAHLDQRTGMSYGFLVRQLSMDVEPAVPAQGAPAALRKAAWEGRCVQEIGGRPYARLELLGGEWFVPVPEVWLLTTRSGCEKTNPDPAKDLMRMGFRRGEVILDTPRGVPSAACRPSYDTWTILACALGNAIAASILRALGANPAFPEALRGPGLSISHWHGYPAPGSAAPPGYFVHGQANPPVSCSTPQSAIYAFAGKLETLERALNAGMDYRGGVHIEPHHGTNVDGVLSLAESARWAAAATARRGD